MILIASDICFRHVIFPSSHFVVDLPSSHSKPRNVVSSHAHSTSFHCWMQNPPLKHVGFVSPARVTAWVLLTQDRAPVGRARHPGITSSFMWEGNCSIPELLAEATRSSDAPSLTERLARQPWNEMNVMLLNKLGPMWGDHNLSTSSSFGNILLNNSTRIVKITNIYQQLEFDGSIEWFKYKLHYVHNVHNF